MRGIAFRSCAAQEELPPFPQVLMLGYGFFGVEGAYSAFLPAELLLSKFLSQWGDDVFGTADTGKTDFQATACGFARLDEDEPVSVTDDHKNSG